MNHKLKNLIIFIVIGGIMVSVYLVFIKKSPEQANLAVTGAPVATTGASDTTTGADSELSKDFLTVLLSIKNITLDDSVFSDIAFTNLKDSTIMLVPDGTEGRPNPFAPIGSEANFVPASAIAGFNDAEGGGLVANPSTVNSNGDVIIEPSVSVPDTSNTKPNTTKPKP